MKYYLAIDGKARVRPTGVEDSLISGEQKATDAAFTEFYAHPKVKQIDVMLVLNADHPVPGKRVMSLHRRKGKTDPALWMGDEVTEPTR